MNKKNTRSSNIELMRILAMVLIVASHYTAHGLKAECIDINERLNYSFLQMGGPIGVNLFVMASGYFMVKSCISMPRIAKVLFHVISYAAILSAIAFFIGPPFFDVNLQLMLKSCLGIGGTRSYWFINAYLSLMLLVPFLNILVHQITKKQHLLCICSLTALASVFPACFLIPTYCGKICLFMALYMVAAYLRLYPLLELTKRKLVYVGAAVLLIILAFLGAANIAFEYFHSEYVSSILINSATSQESILMLLVAIPIFILFLIINVGSSRIVNFLASCTLGVYLFHEHPLMRDFIWQKVLHTAYAPYGEHPILHCIGAILGIYIVGTLVDIIWQQTIGRLYAPTERFIIMPIYSQMKKWGKGIIQRIIE